MRKYLRCDFGEWKNSKYKLNSPSDPFIAVVVISKFFANCFHRRKLFSPPQISKTAQLSKGKIHLTAKLTFQLNIERIQLRSQREDLKFQSLQGSVGKLSGDNVLLASSSLPAYLCKAAKI